MKKKNKILSLVLFVGLLFISCTTSITPQLLSIKFIDDRTIEYEFTVALGSDDSGNYSVESFTANPNDDYKIVFQEYFSPKGKIRFNKDIPDGVTFTLDFCDDNGKFILTQSIKK